LSLKSVLQKHVNIDGKEKPFIVGLNFVLLTFLKKKMILYKIIKIINQVVFLRVMTLQIFWP